MGNSKRSSSARWEWSHRSLRLYISILVKEIKSVQDHLRCKDNNKKLEEHSFSTRICLKTVYRAVFKWLSKVIRRLLWFLIGSLKWWDITQPIRKNQGIGIGLTSQSNRRVKPWLVYWFCITSAFDIISLALYSTLSILRNHKQMRFFPLTIGFRASWVLTDFSYWHSNAKILTRVLFFVCCDRYGWLTFLRQERRKLFLLYVGTWNPVQYR